MSSIHSCMLELINMTISVARIGIGRTGQTNTEEHRLDRNAISVGLRGEIHAEEHNNAISVGLKGDTHTEVLTKITKWSNGRSRNH